MSGFVQACSVEEKGMRKLKPLLMSLTSGRLVMTGTCPSDNGAILQKSVGDVLATFADGRSYGIEIKCEERMTGNLFIEAWSNRSRFTLGWIYTLSADLLWYYFISDETLYQISFPDLKKWAFWTVGNEKISRLHTFDLVRQRKYGQLNDTWGYLVPIETIRMEVGLKEFNLKNLSESPQLDFIKEQPK